MKIILFLLPCILLFTHEIHGQKDSVYINKMSSDWINFSKSIQNEKGVKFYYYSDSIPDFKITVDNDSVTLDYLLKEYFSKIGFNVSNDGEGNYFIFTNFIADTIIANLYNKKFSDLAVTNLHHNGSEKQNDFIKSYQNFISEEIIIGTYDINSKNGNVRLSGRVINSYDNSPIYQTVIKVVETGEEILTDKTGYYELKLKPGKYTIAARYRGIYEKDYSISILSDGTLDMILETKPIELYEVTILSNQNENVKSMNLGFEKIVTNSIKKIPSVLGENDVIKVVLLLPGVQNTGELSSGFNVRGSPSDQNMFYINGMPVYNTSHVFGLFSAINSDAVNEFEFYKGNIPSEYGGNLSSIFAIKTKTGKKDKFSARGGIGITSARILLEGPLKKQHTSFLASFRTSYSNWLLNKIDVEDIKGSKVQFYDALIDISSEINKKNVLEVFLYASNDSTDLTLGIKNQYSNIGGVIKWNHSFNSNLKGDFNLIASKYSYSEAFTEIEYLAYSNSFDLEHYEAKFKLKYRLNDQNHFTGGIDSKLYKLHFGDFLPISENSLIKPIYFQPEKGILSSIFLEDQIRVSSNLTANAGLRFNYYMYPGEMTVYEYIENKPLDVDNIIDSTRYGKNELICNYSNLDYRFSAKYEFNNSMSIKASFNTLHQYIFMLSNTISVSPTNKWKLSDTHLKPLSGNQYSIGLYKNFLTGKYVTSVELYYKTVENLNEFKDGADLLTNQYPETNIIQGNLKASGIEFMVKKTQGKVNAWLNYTYSFAYVKVNNEKTGEMNNRGLPYPANYDKPHALNFTMNYSATKRINFSANVIYSTGRPMTYPTSLYFLKDNQITGFSSRNEYRTDDYFRIDVAANFEGNLKKHKLAHSSWSISFYNLTGRKNPYTVYFINEDGRIKGYKISILGSIIPSITYNLKFGNYDD
jgi:hypothetical protein